MFANIKNSYTKFSIIILLFISVVLISEVNTEKRNISALFKELNLDISNKNRTNSILNYDFTSDLIVPDLYMIVNALDTLDESDCKRDAKMVLVGISRREVWSMQLFDSIPKFPEGVLFGSRYQLGNFDECLAVQQTLMPTENATNPIQGKYCLADISFPELKRIPRRQFNSTLHWALCTPHSCDGQDVSRFISSLLGQIMPNVPVNVHATDSNCYVEDGSRFDIKAFSQLDIIYIVCIAGFLFVILTSTVYHLFYLYRKSTSIRFNTAQTRYRIIHDVIVAFSAARNIGRVLQTNSKGNDQNLDCILGIRVISMIIIIAAHAVVFLISGPVLNKDFFDYAMMQIQNSLIINNTLMVDTFLVLSGFLMCKILMHELDRRDGKINVFILYIARYIRLTPAYAVVLGFYCTFMHRIDRGPLWQNRMLLERERCLKSWWINLLYINNYVNTDYLCMFQSWYLAVDTQLFMLAPLIVFPLWYKKRLGEIVLGCVTVVATAVPFFVTYFYKLDPTLLGYPPEINDLSLNKYFIDAYLKTHMRATSYLIGLIFGYIVHKIQTAGLKLNKWVKVTCSFLAITLAPASLMSVLVFYEDGHEYNVVESTVYSGVHRVLWCYAVAWTILYCVTENSGFINKFLSWKMFAPLSRLTYCSYLANGFVELYNYGITRNPHYMSTYNMSHHIVAHVVETFFCAFILCVLFESPIHNIEKILLRREKRRSEIVTLMNSNSSSNSNQR